MNKRVAISQTPAVKFSLLGVGLIVIYSVIKALLFGPLLPKASFAMQNVVSIVLAWLALAAVYYLVAKRQTKPMQALGIKKITLKDIGWGIIGYIVGLVIFGVTSGVFGALGLLDTKAGILQIATLPLCVSIFIPITAAITEEILYRGYLTEQLRYLVKNKWAAALLANVVFTLLHIPLWGFWGAIQIGIWALVPTYLYVRRGNLTSSIIVHLLNDTYSFIFVPLFFMQYIK